jgi:hypothetical protein
MATTPNPLEALTKALGVLAVGAEVAAEIQSAREKHGDQLETPIGNGRTASLLHDLAKTLSSKRHLAYLENGELEELAKAYCQGRTPSPEVEGDSWMKIIFEEFAEALAAEGADVRAELIQLAAMAQAAVLAYDHQNA